MLNNNYHHHIEQKDCIVQSSKSHNSQETDSELKREIAVVTANLLSGPTISTIEKTSSSVAASNSPLFSSNNSDIYLLGHNKLSPNSNSHADNNNLFLSLNDLTTVLQQEHIIQQTQSSSSSTSLSSPKQQQSITSSLPPSSSNFIASAATTTSTTPSTTVFNNIKNSNIISHSSYNNCNNNNNNNNIDCSLTAGSPNCITPVSSLGSSSQSSGSALSLGNSLNGNSKNRINAHFNLNLQHISASSRNHITGMNQKQHQTQYPQSPTNMSLGSSGPYSPIMENGNIANSTLNGNGSSIGGGGGNGSGSSNSSIIGMSTAFSQTSLHQLQQNIYQSQQQLSSPTSLHRSMSSTSSSMATSPMSVNSQHHPHYQQQQQLNFHQRQNHHQHYLQHQQQQQQQQQQHQHNHHHSHHNQQQSYSTNSPSNSKSCWCFGGDVTYHFKTLVPAVAAGAIIGKGGETIASLQRDTGARVKMSKSHDFYPGTSERVCLITGSVDAIMTVLDFIMDKIREKPDLTTKLTDIEAKQAQERDKQVKILVPNSTAGMIIGKAGAYIKQIKEESGSYVQISQKPKDITLQERCITIIGEKDNNKIACKMILAKIVEDPQSGTCLNVSYADVNGPVANYNPTGSPYATNQNAISSSTASLNSALGSSVGGTGLLVNGTGINLQLNLGPPNQSPNPTIATQLLDHIKVYLRGSGYADNVASEIVAALGVLAKYGILGVGVGLPHTNGAHSAPVSYLGVSALEQSAAAATAAAAGSVFSALGQVNLEQFIGQSTAAPRQSLETATAAGPFDPFRHAGSQAATPISINNNSFGLAAATTGGATAQALGAQTLGVLSKSPTPGDLGTKDSRSVEVNESYIGTILGPNGRSLVEIQHVSGAIIQISKKGIFAPGTRNRIVTISGQPNAIAMARFLIEKKIHEEETKRARQNPVTNVVQ